MITAAMIAEVYMAVLERTPWRGYYSPFLDLLDGHRTTYRQRLDRPEYNCRGRQMTRHQVVEWNLQRLGNIRMNPARLR
jgi:hypothetical protein